MNKNTELALLVLGTFTSAMICIVFVFCATTLYNIILHNETVTVYTTEDIIYLEGNKITSESGIYDMDLPTRSVAIDIFEEITASHARSHMRENHDYSEM